MQQTLQVFILKFLNLVKHIKSQDGFTGLYRGLIPRILEGIVGSIITQKVTEVLQGVIKI